MRSTACVLSLAASASSFVPHGPRRPFAVTAPTTSTSTTSTSLGMVFDFFRKRAEEGVEQLTELTKKASEGRLGEGLSDAAAYTKRTNEAFAAGLAKSRTRLLYDLDNLVNNEGSDFLEDLEDVLLQADLGVTTAEEVMEEVRSLRDEESDTFFSQADLKSVLRDRLLEALGGADRSITFSEDPDVPTVLLLMGANGMGKTTTIGKLAHRLRTEGDCDVLVAACDTFRAGAVDQLAAWVERSNSTLFRPEVQGDSAGKAASPAAVLYGAIDRALSPPDQQPAADVLLVDTSGRLSNNDALTRELVKMKNVVRKRLGPLVSEGVDVPHETLLVVDAAMGRAALDSAREWHREVGLTGLVLTKLDGSARGGSVVAVSRELGVPVKLVGVGEGLEDLRDFDPETFVDSLLGIGTAGGNTKNADEAKDLQKRLETMRRARDERAKSNSKKTASAAPTTNIAAVVDEDEDDDDDDGLSPEEVRREVVRWVRRSTWGSVVAVAALIGWNVAFQTNRDSYGPKWFMVTGDTGESSGW